jgi:C-3',4' desaturase CrtD
MIDVAVVGAGIAGMATAARIQARGYGTAVFEAHGKIGGCAGYFRRRRFSFDVGATTLVDFEGGGVGQELLDAIGMPMPPADLLPGYMAWLPDRTLTLHRDHARWSAERLTALGDTPAHRGFWALMDTLAGVFWSASRRGIKLPLQSAGDIVHNLRALGLRHVPLARYLLWTMGDALRHAGLRGDVPLCGLLSMLIEDTVHSTIDEAPLINAALGITIRGAGLSRAVGGMRGFWEAFARHYLGIGGSLHVNHRVLRISGRKGRFTLHTQRGDFEARQVVCTLPAALTASIAPEIVGHRLDRKLARDVKREGGAVIVFLGVPDAEVSGQTFTHHQIMHDYGQPLGSGNNMFISVSAPDDTISAPPGFRAVMISTHCALEPWEGLSDEASAARSREITDRLVTLARRVYPRLGENAVVLETGTPRTYARFTGRPRGAVGGVRQTLWNSNQFAIPQDIGVPGFMLAGDSTFPGLGTVAGVLGSRIAAEAILRGT